VTADSLCIWHHYLLQGVGSHAAHLLLRSGVGKLRLVDFDQVTLSSLNRHAVATRQDVGIPKATCLQRHFQQIMPEVRHRAGGSAAVLCPDVDHVSGAVQQRL
jgi:molybdopterin/thiamine biosynthesis adenylyltransferase